MKPLRLRDYQDKCVAAALDSAAVNRFTLFTMFMGMGKTETIIGMIDIITQSPAARVLFLVNRVKLLIQTYERITDYIERDRVGMVFGRIKQLHRQVTVASIQSVKDTDYDFVFLDEAHNINQEKGQYADYVARLKPDCRIIACTATPYRSDGFIYGDGKWFDKPCFDLGCHWGVEHGYLVPVTMKSGKNSFKTEELDVVRGDYDAKQLTEMVNDKKKLRAQVGDVILRTQDRKALFWITTRVSHATSLAAELSRLGEPACVVHSKQAEQDIHIKLFREGRVRHLINVAMLNEGFDCPPIDTVIMLRPTRSATLYVQSVGRGLRPCEGKNNVLFLDYGRVVEHLGFIDNPVIKKQTKSTPPELRACDNCGSFFERSLDTCPDCGHKVEVSKRAHTDKNLTRKAYTPVVTKHEEKCVRVKITKTGRRSRYIRMAYYGEEGYITAKYYRLPHGLGRFRSDIKAQGFEDKVPASHMVSGTLFYNVEDGHKKVTGFKRA